MSGQGIRNVFVVKNGTFVCGYGQSQCYLLGNLPCGNWKQGRALQEGRHAIAAAVYCLIQGDGWGEHTYTWGFKWRENGWMETGRPWPESSLRWPQGRWEVWWAPGGGGDDYRRKLHETSKPRRVLAGGDDKRWVAWEKDSWERQ